MRIVPEILNGIAVAVEGLFDEAIPVQRIELVAKEQPLERVIERRADLWNAELTVVI